MKNIPLTKKERIAIIAGIGFLIVGYFAYQSFAGTTIGTSIKSGSNLTGSTDITSGMVGYWTFDGISSVQNFVDSSGTGNTGYLTGTVSTSTVPGAIGQSMNFDGVDDYVTVPNSATLHPSIPVTVSAWIYLNTTPSSNVGIFTSSMTSFFAHNWNGVWVSLANGILGANYGNNSACGATGRRSIAGTTVLSSKKWYHVVAVLRGPTDMSLYVNGVDEGGSVSGSGGSVSYASISAGIGVYSNCTDGSKFDFPGKIDDVRFYNRALTVQEVDRLYELGNGTHTGVSLQTSASPTGANTNENSGLVGYWTFDGVNMKQNVVDSSGQGNTGYLTSFASTTTAPGKIGQTLKFDGVNDYVNVGNTTSLSLSGTAMTGAVWIYFTPTTNGPIFGKTSSDFTYEFDVDNAGHKFSALIKTGGTTHTVPYQSGFASDLVPYNNTWVHLAFTYNGSTIMPYINGVALPSFAVAATGNINSTSDPFQIGARGDSAVGFFNSKIDDVRIYNRALSANEIAKLYQEGGGVTNAASVQTNSNTGNSLSTGLVGYWTFDGNKMFQNVVDSSGKGNTGYLTSFNSTTTIPGKVGQALKFNGTSNYVSVPNSSSLNLSASSFTISAWVKFNSFYQGTCLGNYIVVKDKDSQAGAYVLGVYDPGACGGPTGVEKAVVNFFDSGGGGHSAVSAVAIVSNQWYHITGTYDGAVETIYVNGVSSGTTVTSAVVGSNTNPLTIGEENASGFEYRVNGLIDDVRIYNRALSASEVARLYQLGK